MINIQNSFSQALASGATYANSDSLQENSSSFLQFLKKPPQNNPLASMTQGSGIFQIRSLLKSPGLDFLHEVDYGNREVSVFGTYRNHLTGDTLRLWQSVYPELGDYTLAMFEAARKRQWLKGLVGQESSAYGNSDQQFDLQLPFTTPQWLKDFELDKPRLELNGELSFGVFGSGTYTEGVQDYYGKNSLIPDFNPEFNGNFSVKGKIGRYITVEVDNSDGLGVKNNIKVTYKENEKNEFEDHILQEVEAGNTSLQLPGTQLTGYSENHRGLFGIKSKWKIGDFWLTAIASQEGGSQENYTLNSQGTETDLVLRDKEYINGKHFFITFSDRESYITSRLNGQVLSSTPDKVGLTIWKETSGGSGSSGQNAGSLIKVGVKGYLPDSSKLKTPLYDNLTVKQLQPKEYFYDPQRRTITILAPSSNAVYLAKWEWGPEFAALGRGSSTLEDGGAGIIFRDRQYNFSLEKLKIKNRYSVGYNPLDKSRFSLNLKDNKAAQSNENGNYLKMLGLADSSGVFKRDNTDLLFSKDNELILPCIKSESKPTWYNGSVADFNREACLEPFKRLWQNSNEDFYSKDIRELSQVGTQFYFEGKSKRRSSTLKVTDNQSVSSGGCIDIAPGSEKLKMGSVELKRGVDYEVLYELGQINLISDLAKDPNSEIQVTYECEPLFKIENKFLLGLRGEYFIPKLEEGSLFGTTFLFKNQQTSEARPGLGREPFTSMLLGANIHLTDQAKWMTKMINWLPFVYTTAPSRWRFDAEVAMSMNNPNTKGSAQIDDFESSKNELTFSLLRTGWTPASPADQDGVLDYKHAGQMIWHSNNRYLFKDIYQDAGSSQVNNQDIRTLQLKLTPNDNLSGKSWGGIQRANADFYQDLTRFDYIELVARGDQGELLIDFGQVSEDLSIHGFAPDKTLESEIDYFTGKRIQGDVGLAAMAGGLYSDSARQKWSCSDFGCTASLIADPSQDDYIAQETSSDPTRAINGTKNNNLGDSYSGDSEDLNRNNSLDTKEEYLRYKISLRNTPYESLNKGWRRYIIPLKSFSSMVASSGMSYSQLIKNVGYTRLIYTGLDEGSSVGRLQIAKLSVVGNQWQPNAIPQDTLTRNVQEVVVDGVKTQVDLSQVQTPADSNYIDVRVINNRDQIGQYFSSPNTLIEKDKSDGSPLREQALVIRYGNLKPNTNVSATRFLDGEDKDLTQYKQLRMEIHLDPKDIPDSANVRFGLQMGRGTYESSEGFYEWSFRPKVVRCGNLPEDLKKSCHDQNWNSNALALDLTDWPLLKNLSGCAWQPNGIDTIKALKNNGAWVCSKGTELSDSLVLKNARADAGILDADGNPERAEQLAVYGNPSLGRINWMRLVVYSDKDLKTANDRANGEFWINDLRLEGVRKDLGYASRVSTQLDFGDVMVLSGDLNYKNGNFANLSSANKSPMPSLAEAKTVLDYRGDLKFQLNKFFPDEWKLKMPFTLSKSTSVERPYLRPRSDLELDLSQGGHADFADIFTDVLNGDISYKDRERELRDSALSKGYQTLREQTTFSIAYRKDYVPERNLFKEYSKQIFFERPIVNYRYNINESRSPLSADTSKTYRTELAYNLGQLDRTAKVFNPWPEKFDITFADFTFTRNENQNRNPDFVVDQDARTVDYILDLNHKVDLEWSLFPFLKLSYGLDVTRDMDRDKESFSGENFWDPSTGDPAGFMAYHKFFGLGVDEWSVSRKVIGADTLKDASGNIIKINPIYGIDSASVRSSDAAKDYGILRNERSRNQIFKIMFNPKMVKFLDTRFDFNTTFAQAKTYSNDFNPYKIENIQSDYWNFRRENHFEFRPTLQILELFPAGEIKTRVSKLGMSSINMGWTVDLKSDNENYRLSYLRDNLGLTPSEMALYSLGLGDGEGWRNPYDIVTGEMSKSHPSDYTRFAEYMNTRTDSLLNKNDFRASIKRKANVGTRWKLPLWDLQQRYDLNWSQEFQHTRETPLYTDTSLSWPQWSLSSDLPNVAQRMMWTTQNLKALTFSNKFTYNRVRESKPYRADGKVTNYTYAFDPILGTSATTKGDISITNNFSVSYSEGWFRTMGEDTTRSPSTIGNDTITVLSYPVRGYFDALPNGWVVQDVRKLEIWSWKNALGIGWDIPTNKGLQLWRWFMRLKNPIKMKFDLLYQYNVTTNLDHYTNYNGVPEVKRVTPNTSLWEAKQAASYQFSDKISSESWIKYTRRSELITGALNQGNHDEVSSTLAYEFMVRMKF